MIFLWTLYRRAVDERNALREIRRQLVVDLATERQRAADVALMLCEPCNRCLDLERALDMTLIERDAARSTISWCEQIGFGGVKADGSE